MMATMKVALTVNDFLRRAEQVYPHRVGVVDEPTQPAESWGEFTYGDMAMTARAIAAGLDSLGIGQGERVAMVSHNSARLLTYLFGVSGSGRVLVPINFRLVAEEVKYIVAHCGARVLLVDPELEAEMAEVQCEHKFTIGADADSALMRFDVEPRLWEYDEDATATINYTSGTTARPKGVQLTHRNIWLNATTFGWQLGISDRDVYLHTLPQFHCNGWGVLYAVTGMGGKHIILRKVDGAEILRRIDQHGVTVLCGAPAVANAILDAAANWDGPIPGRDRVRMVCAGAPPPTKTIERMETELGWEFIQIYGLTETTPLLTMNRQRAETDALTPAELMDAIALGDANVLTRAKGVGKKLAERIVGELAGKPPPMGRFGKFEAASAAGMASAPVAASTGPRGEAVAGRVEPCVDRQPGARVGAGDEQRAAPVAGERIGQLAACVAGQQQHEEEDQDGAHSALVAAVHRLIGTS